MALLMRSLALGGVVSCVTLVGWAAGPDRDWFDAADVPPPPARKTPAPAVRSRIPATKAPLHEGNASPNYYQELFSKGEPTGENEAEIPPPPASRNVPGVPVREKVTSNRTTHKPPLLRPKNPEADQASEQAAADEEWANLEQRSQVMKAELKEESTRPPAENIQQVRIETRPKTPRVPVPPARGRIPNTPLSQSLEPSPVTTAPSMNGPLASAITLEWVKKSEFNLGQECAVDLVVKNTGSSAIERVAVDAVFQSPIRLTSAKPHPTENRDRLTWQFDTLPAGAEQRIALKLVPSRRGDLGLQAFVHLTGSVASTFRVEEPLLKVALKGPAEVMLGDSASQMVAVSNPGTGAAHDVKLTATVSRGLEHARGQGEAIEMEIGTIMPGESRTIRLPLTGVKGGSQTVQVAAVSSSEASTVVTANISVVSPSLTVAADGPALRYKGRNAKFSHSITNDGTVANNNVRVVQTVAEGFQFVSADHGGKYDPSLKTVSWFLGRLEPDQKIQVSCELTAVALGDFSQQVTVASDAGARAETTIDTQVEGAAALSMEIVDLDDPVEVGVETAYEIRVKNNGTKAAANVAVTCELSAGVQLLSAKGPTDAVAENRTLIFKPVTQLAPGQESIYRVHVKGTQDGNHRVKARVLSDALSEPILKEEQTKFYADAKR